MSSKFDFKVGYGGKLLVHRKGEKRTMVLDGYEKRCFLALIARGDEHTREMALENIWQALTLRADGHLLYATRHEYRNGGK